MLKAKKLEAQLAEFTAVLDAVKRNERENDDFLALSKVYKEEFGMTPSEDSGEDGVPWRVVLHLLNRMRRLEARVRELEGD